MNEKYDTYAVAIIIVFGALVIGGLMAAAIAGGHRDAFFFALGSATAAWMSGHAVFLDKPRTFIAFVGVAVLMAIGATLVIAF